MKGVKMLNIQTEQRYNEIVENYSDMIFRIAYQYLFNKYDAEDIVQEVFVKLLTKRVIFKDESIAYSAHQMSHHGKPQ